MFSLNPVLSILWVDFCIIASILPNGHDVYQHQSKKNDNSYQVKDVKFERGRSHGNSNAHVWKQSVYRPIIVAPNHIAWTACELAMPISVLCVLLIL